MIFKRTFENIEIKLKEECHFGFTDWHAFSDNCKIEAWGDTLDEALESWKKEYYRKKKKLNEKKDNI